VTEYLPTPKIHVDFCCNCFHQKLTRAGECRLLRGDLCGDCVIFCGEGAAFPAFRGDFRGLTPVCNAHDKTKTPDTYDHSDVKNVTISLRKWAQYPRDQTKPSNLLANN